MTDALLPLPPEDEVRRLRLQESIDEDARADPLPWLKHRVLEPGAPLRLHCQACQHEWDMPYEKGMLVDAFIARMKGNLICPRCGNKSRAKKKAIVVAEGPAELQG